jgi:hypothetical protein
MRRQLPKRPRQWCAPTTKMIAVPPVVLRDGSKRTGRSWSLTEQSCPDRNLATVRPTRRSPDWLVKINALIERLTADVPVDPAERNEEQQARWILANIVDWHRREEKAGWCEYFRLAALSAEDLLDERAELSGLIFAATAGGTAKAPIHRYRFPPQETEIRGGGFARPHPDGDAW